MERAAVWAGAAAPLVLLWLAVHAVLFAAIALIWGATIVLKAVLGWLLHVAVLAAMLLTGFWLARTLWRAMQRPQQA